MRVYRVRRVLLWIGLQWGFLAVCSAQSAPGAPSLTGLLEADIETLPKYRIEIIAFAYHDFDPTEERFEQAPRGTLLYLLNPTLLETHERIEPDVSARLLESLLSLDEHSPALIPTEPGIATTWLAELPQQPPGVAPLGQDLSTADRFEPSSTAQAHTEQDFAVEDFAVSDFAAEPAEEQLLPGEEPWYRLLSAEELELTDIYDRLERLDAYTPLVHGGWVQEGFAEDRALPFDLSLLGTFNPLGTIRLHVQRFLHVTVALRYQAQRTAAELLHPVSTGLEEITFPARYDLHVQRRTRSGELHFFDHPAFGVLVLVRPRPEEPEAADEDPTPAA